MSGFFFWMGLTMCVCCVYTLVFSKFVKIVFLCLTHLHIYNIITCFRMFIENGTNWLVFKFINISHLCLDYLTVWKGSNILRQHFHLVMLSSNLSKFSETQICLRDFDFVNPENLDEIWRNLSVLFVGGMNFKPFSPLNETLNIRVYISRDKPNFSFRFSRMFHKVECSRML